MNTSKVLVSILALTLFACGDSESPKDTAGPSNRLNWAGVPSKFHPKTEDIDFRTDGVERIYVDAFGFEGDVELVYLRDLPANTGYLRLYTVWDESVTWGDLRPRPSGKNLELKNYGVYQCSIRVTNGQIVALKGGCYVRLQVFLPQGAELEVYNVGQLISKRFIPMDTETFLKAIEDATWDEDKLPVIEEFLRSYKNTMKKPKLTSKQLGTVIDDFNRSEAQLTALRRLHLFVSDRENLASMIDDEFPFQDENKKARKIVGLP
jgi:hypothetical protein